MVQAPSVTNQDSACRSMAGFHSVARYHGVAVQRQWLDLCMLLAQRPLPCCSRQPRLFQVGTLCLGCSSLSALHPAMGRLSIVMEAAEHNYSQELGSGEGSSSFAGSCSAWNESGCRGRGDLERLPTTCIDHSCAESLPALPALQTHAHDSVARPSIYQSYISFHRTMPPQLLAPGA